MSVCQSLMADMSEKKASLIRRMNAWAASSTPDQVYSFLKAVHAKQDQVHLAQQRATLKLIENDLVHFGEAGLRQGGVGHGVLRIRFPGSCID